MVIAAFFTWWYGRGWRERVAMLRERLASTMDYFSIDLLLRTFFSPFRQISAGKVQGPLGVQMRAFFDRLVSRIIGAGVRTVIIVIGTVTIAFHVVFGALLVLAWAFVPLLPIAGVILWIVGWVPWSS